MIAEMSRIGKNLVWALPLCLLAGAMLVVPLRILDKQGLPRYRALNEELVEVRRFNDHARRNVRRLEFTVRALRTHPEAVERIARDELGMLYEDEVLFQFPQESQAPDDVRGFGTADPAP
jgi:cell division protein FtsB